MERTSSTRIPDAPRPDSSRRRSWAPTSATADAYATATFAMGDKGPAWAAALTDYETLCITSDQAVLTTPGLDRYRVS